ncbi:hypothetical protein [Dickeya dadantii]|uniref:hypothetical protein n=1 Tax=Dickeya dadantii TaxID=204038 RepID=UPI001C0E85F9|nr:hypothetical protein [Dickeya dadantii]QWT40144.1 hypothetical protein KNV89_17575 [Dickeya dadantii]
MKAIIFDLDNTLFSTDNCQPYLRSRAGREVISRLIIDGKLKVDPINEKIIPFVNKLLANRECHVYIFSDSPQNYCLSILEKNKLNIARENVYGSQHKPTAEDAQVLEAYDNIVVVGDSPKDVYFAHMNSAASILVGKFTEKNIKFYNKWTKPTAIVTKMEGLEKCIDDFLVGRLLFVEPEISDDYLTVNHNEVDIFNLDLERIGYAFEYWPNPSDWKNDKQKDVWFEVKRSIKVSKNLTPKQIDDKDQVSFYNQDGNIGFGKAFRNIIYVYFLEFMQWLIDNDIKGRVYLVATPSSVPFECNKSAPIQILIEWWAKYAYYRKDKLKCQIFDGSAVERFWPTKPAHMSNGKREVAPHLETLGVYQGAVKFHKPDAVIIIDDVVTSGTQMKAVATLLAATDMFPHGTPVYGYALVKTTRTGSSLRELLRLFSDSEKAGA